MAAPVVVGLDPADGIVGSSVTVGGSGFTGTTAVSNPDGTSVASANDQFNYNSCSAAAVGARGAALKS